MDDLIESILPEAVTEVGKGSVGMSFGKVEATDKTQLAIIVYG